MSCDLSNVARRRQPAKTDVCMCHMFAVVLKEHSTLCHDIKKLQSSEFRWNMRCHAGTAWRFAARAASPNIVSHGTHTYPAHTRTVRVPIRPEGGVGFAGLNAGFTPCRCVSPALRHHPAPSFPLPSIFSMHQYITPDYTAKFQAHICFNLRIGVRSNAHSYSR